MKCSALFRELFNVNDGNGRWLSFNIHRHLYFVLKRFYGKFVLPEYKSRDYQEVFGIYPFVIKEEEKANMVEEAYVGFVVGCLKEQTSFEARLKAMQELRKIIEGEVKLFKLEEKSIYNMISSQGVIDYLLSEFNFNPEIFKRFMPIL